MMKTIGIITALLALSNSVTMAHPIPCSLLSVKEEIGKIKGLILDANGARVARAVVRIENAKLKREVKSGAEGNFEVELPSGVYRIVIQAHGFRKFEYSPLNVKPNMSELINIHLEVEHPKMPVKVRLEPYRSAETWGWCLNMGF
jgi:Carboxypeptidase regulatory-like domain